MSSTEAWMQMQAQYGAEDLYRRAYFGGWLGRIGAALRGQSSQLLNLAACARTWKIQGQHFAGRQTVHIQQIRGSEGRSEYFDRFFRPRQKYTQRRWLSVAQACLMGINLPPVELIQVGGTYFVRDGHHRISVAQALEHARIDANVTVWQVAAEGAQAEQIVRCRTACKPA